jgi:hypothetical protein
MVNLGRGSIEDVEAMIDFPHDRKTVIAGDLCALKINADGSAEIRPYDSALSVTTGAHADSPPPEEFAA